jgi:hypothetical protein
MPAIAIPCCGNDAYHVFALGASHCSICGWCRGCREVSCRQHGQGPEVIVSTQDYRAYAFTVVGVGPFPLDMLRYDSALPLREEDAAQIVASFTALHEEQQRDGVEAVLYEARRVHVELRAVRAADSGPIGAPAPQRVPPRDRTKELAARVMRPAAREVRQAKPTAKPASARERRKQRLAQVRHDILALFPAGGGTHQAIAVPQLPKLVHRRKQDVYAALRDLARDKLLVIRDGQISAHST